MSVSSDTLSSLRMIAYDPREWLRPVFQFHKSDTFRKLFLLILLIGAITGGVAWLENGYLHMSQDSRVKNITLMHQLLGFAISMLLVFRTNTAYDRWWEGRMQWGALVNHTRNLAVSASAMFPVEDKEARHRLAVLISNFCISLKEHLREGTKLEELMFLSEEDKKIYPTKGHLPNYISLQIHQLVEYMHRENKITKEDFLNMKPHLQAPIDILGACERIKKTPIPFSYNVYLKIFITTYAILLPLAMIPEVGYWAVPLVMIIFFAFIGVQLMAEEIEDPFGLDCNDLPTGDIAHTIKNNVFEILESKSSLGKDHVVEEYAKIF